MALFVSLIAFVGAADNIDEYQSISGIMKTVRFGKHEEKAEEDTSEEDSSISQTNGSAGNQQKEEEIYHISSTEKEEALEKLRESIAVKVEKIIVEDELFRKHDLTLAYAADKVGVFKEELLDYINYKYDMSFQNFINTLRIGYAEKYLMTHDRVTQNEIALECGFSGASSFNTAFSKKNGVTPKIWKDRQLELLKNQEA